MKVHYLQHVPFEGLGYIEMWLKENHHEISATRFYEPDYQLPALEEIDALIIMGGPMSVYDNHPYSWLDKEKSFIKNCIQAGKKVLGICLGAQLIAVCLGAQVHRATYKEIGWYPVSPAKDAKKLAWFFNLFQDNPTVFHWHGDQFTIPEPDSLDLLQSEANSNQAFIYKDHVLGLQFHLETNATDILRIIENCANDLDGSKYVQTQEFVIQQALPNTVKTNKIAEQLLNHFLITPPLVLPL